MTPNNDDIKKLLDNQFKLIHQEINTVKSDISHEIRMSRMEIINRISELEVRVVQLEVSNQDILKSIKKLKRDLKASIDFFDIDYLKLKKQVDAVEAKVRFISA